MNSYLISKNGVLSIQRQRTPPSGTLTVIEGQWYSDQVGYFTPYRAYVNPNTQKEVRLTGTKTPPKITIKLKAGETLGTGEELKTVTPSEFYSYDFDQVLFDSDTASKLADKNAQDEAKANYQYAESRSSEYVELLSQAPNKNQVDAIGHLLDSIIDAVASGDNTGIIAIKTEIDKIKARHPK
jgi:hypothetical protein